MGLTGDPTRKRRRPPAGPRALALRWLARRPLTAAEVRRRLERQGFADDEVEPALVALLDEGLIDDAALALDYIVLRAERLHLGKGRLLLDLTRRGVDENVAERAWNQAIEDGDLDPDGLLEAALERRIAREGERTVAARRRVYNALLRAGFPAAELYAELSRRMPVDEAGHGYHDDEGS